MIHTDRNSRQQLKQFASSLFDKNELIEIRVIAKSRSLTRTWIQAGGLLSAL